MKKVIVVLVLLVILALGGFIGVKYYSWVFSKTVSGEVMRVERVSAPSAIVTGGGTIQPAQMFSFAVAIRDDQGVIHTASSEDRQWSLVSEKQCVTAKLFPYPPWELDKGNTYFNARLEKIFDCAKK